MPLSSKGKKVAGYVELGHIIKAWHENYELAQRKVWELRKIRQHNATEAQ
jgi:hypothetical protein